MELNDLEKIRLEKALKMREEGNEPYPTRANPSHNTVEAIRAFEADETARVEATVAGRLRAMRPMGKVTFAHIEDGQGRLQPAPGTEAHGLYLQWSWFAEATYARPIGEIVNHRRAFGEAGENPAVVEEMKGRARLCSEAVDRALQGRSYLLGEEFSAADIMMGYSVMIARRFTSTEGLANLNAYWERLSARPAYQRAAAVA